MALELDIDLGAEQLEQRIVEAAARQILSSRSYDEDGDEVSYPSEIARLIKQHLDEAVAEVAKEQAEPIVREALAGTLEVRDRYGYERGAQKTLAEMVGDEIKKAVTGGRGSSHAEQSLLVKIVREEIERKVGGEVKEAIAEAKSTALKALRENLNGAIETEMRKAAF